MSNRFGSNTGQVERFIERLYHLRSNQWEQIRQEMHRIRGDGYTAAARALKQFVAAEGERSGTQRISQVAAGPRPEQQNVHRAVVHCRVTCTRPLRLPEDDAAVVAAENAAGALAAGEWMRSTRDLEALYAPFAEVIPLPSLD